MMWTVSLTAGAKGGFQKMWKDPVKPEKEDKDFERERERERVCVCVYAQDEGKGYDLLKVPAEQDGG